LGLNLGDISTALQPCPRIPKLHILSKLELPRFKLIDPTGTVALILVQLLWRFIVVRSTCLPDASSNPQNQDDPQTNYTITVLKEPEFQLLTILGILHNQPKANPTRWSVVHSSSQNLTSPPEGIQGKPGSQQPNPAANSHHPTSIRKAA
jgi:hypothetical protein